MLTIAGAPVGRELGRYYLKDELERAPGTNRAGKDEDSKNQMSNERVADGSIIIVIATDAPVDHRNLRRMAARAMLGLARTGSAATNGSGDYAIAFSTAPEVRIRAAMDRNAPRDTRLLANDAMSPLFLAVIEATEEAIYNSMFRATTMTARGRTIEALPLDRTIEILRKYGALARQK